MKKIKPIMVQEIQVNNFCKDFDEDCFNMTSSQHESCFRYDECNGHCPFVGRTK